jgi:hypothetical protein
VQNILNTRKPRGATLRYDGRLTTPQLASALYPLDLSRGGEGLVVAMKTPAESSAWM